MWKICSDPRPQTSLPGKEGYNDLRQSLVQAVHELHQYGLQELPTTEMSIDAFRIVYAHILASIDR